MVTLFLSFFYALRILAKYLYLTLFVLEGGVNHTVFKIASKPRKKLFYDRFFCKNILKFCGGHFEKETTSSGGPAEIEFLKKHWRKSHRKKFIFLKVLPIFVFVVVDVTIFPKYLDTSYIAL